MQRFSSVLSKFQWREPWHWPRSWQYASFAMSGVLGVLLLSPWWGSNWQDWLDATQAEAALLLQQENTQKLREQTTQLLKEHQASAMMLSDVKTLGYLAEAEGLQLSQLGVDKAEHNAQLHALQIEQLPVRLRVQGSWHGWLNWVSQWSTAAPGVALASLELKADPSGGVTAQVLAVVPQSAESEPAFELASANPQQVLDPFSAQTWADAQRTHAEQHPSYSRLVIPEILRARDVLEAFPRERLQYVGNLRSGDTLEGLVKVLPLPTDDKAKVMSSVYRVRVGSHLGHDFGRVVAVQSDALRVQELALSPTGEWKTREVELPLIEARP